MFFKTRTPTPQYGVVNIIAIMCWFSHNVIKIQTRELLMFTFKGCKIMFCDNEIVHLNFYAFASCSIYMVAKRDVI